MSKIILDNERLFCLELIKYFNDTFGDLFTIKKIRYNKSFVDMYIFNNNHGTIAYIEHKGLLQPINKDYHIINLTKIINILKSYPNSFVVWDYRFADGDLYYKKVDEMFLKYDRGECRDQNIIKVPICETKLGFNELCEELLMLLIVKNL